MARWWCVPADRRPTAGRRHYHSVQRSQSRRELAHGRVGPRQERRKHRSNAAVRCVRRRFRPSSDNIFTARSELREVLFLAPSVCGVLFVYEISREWLNLFATISHGKRTCLVPRLDEFEGQSQRSKVKVTGDKNAFFGPFGGLRAV